MYNIIGVPIYPYMYLLNYLFINSKQRLYISANDPWMTHIIRNYNMYLKFGKIIHTGNSNDSQVNFSITYLYNIYSNTSGI